ncbi:unnamed protein product [Notodromas monacha]|uniref:Uncharacterized protein n=1 Tax=Notodromas monacha TaxID=399045 RepID=A0A7R9GFD5_9CRUS|nr:unnamed protein product [Notodromas monacha]CAG0919237.1 unnamed protein product [Notodromas monacha]
METDLQLDESSVQRMSLESLFKYPFLLNELPEGFTLGGIGAASDTETNGYKGRQEITISPRKGSYQTRQSQNSIRSRQAAEVKEDDIRLNAISTQVRLNALRDTAYRKGTFQPQGSKKVITNDDPDKKKPLGWPFLSDFNSDTSLASILSSFERKEASADQSARSGELELTQKQRQNNIHNIREKIGRRRSSKISNRLINPVLVQSKPKKSQRLENVRTPKRPNPVEQFNTKKPAPNRQPAFRPTELFNQNLLLGDQNSKEASTIKSSTQGNKKAKVRTQPTTIQPELEYDYYEGETKGNSGKIPEGLLSRRADLTEDYFILEDPNKEQSPKIFTNPTKQTNPQWSDSRANILKTRKQSPAVNIANIESKAYSRIRARPNRAPESDTTREAKSFITHSRTIKNQQLQASSSNNRISTRQPVAPKRRGTSAGFTRSDLGRYRSSELSETQQNQPAVPESIPTAERRTIDETSTEEVAEPQSPPLRNRSHILRASRKTPEPTTGQVPSASLSNPASRPPQRTRNRTNVVRPAVGQPNGEQGQIPTRTRTRTRGPKPVTEPNTNDADISTTLQPTSRRQPPRRPTRVQSPPRAKSQTLDANLQHFGEARPVKSNSDQEVNRPTPSRQTNRVPRKQSVANQKAIITKASIRQPGIAENNDFDIGQEVPKKPNRILRPVVIEPATTTTPNSTSSIQPFSEVEPQLSSKVLSTDDQNQKILDNLAKLSLPPEATEAFLSAILGTTEASTSRIRQSSLASEERLNADTERRRVIPAFPKQKPSINKRLPAASPQSVISRANAQISRTRTRSQGVLNNATPRNTQAISRKPIVRRPVVSPRVKFTKGEESFDTSNNSRPEFPQYVTIKRDSIPTTTAISSTVPATTSSSQLDEDFKEYDYEQDTENPTEDYHEIIPQVKPDIPPQAENAQFIAPTTWTPFSAIERFQRENLQQPSTQDHSEPVISSLKSSPVGRDFDSQNFNLPQPDANGVLRFGFNSRRPPAQSHPPTAI